ncbi:MAG: Uma2 family endonuclease [Chloroflexota bacterium]
MSVLTRVGMPLDEFIRSYDEAPFELIDGERILLVPPVAEHGEVIRLLVIALALYGQVNPNFIFYTEMPFVLEALPNWVKGSRVPDLMIYDRARLQVYQAEHPDWKSKPFILVPDLCVEVISASDSYIDVDAKVERYLEDGVRLIWVFNPRLSTITAHAPGSITRLTESEALDGGEVLPGFSISVGTLFGQQ